MNGRRWPFEDLEGPERRAALSRMTREGRLAAWEALTAAERAQLAAETVGRSSYFASRTRANPNSQI